MASVGKFIWSRKNGSNLELQEILCLFLNYVMFEVQSKRKECLNEISEAYRIDR